MAVISLSREVGSGGHEIAQLVSEKLGYRLFDQPLMAKLGFEAGLTKEGEVVDLTAEKHHTQSVLEKMFPFNIMDTVALGAYEASGQGAEDKSAALVTRLINIAYAQGNVVIEGRGGQGVLRGKPDVLQVRVVAPKQQRIAWIAKRDNLIPIDAEQKVKEADLSQADYIHQYFGADIHDPHLYDLIINTGKISIESAADAVLNLFNQMFPPAK